MFPEILLGPIAIVMGFLLILGRRRFPKIVHAGLKMFYGEPVADDAVGKHAWVHVLIVGILISLIGCAVTVSAFLVP